MTFLTNKVINKIKQVSFTIIFIRCKEHSIISYFKQTIIIINHIRPFDGSKEGLTTDGGYTT